MSQHTLMLPFELKHFKMTQFCKDGNKFTFEERHHHYIKLEGITSSMQYWTKLYKTK